MGILTQIIGLILSLSILVIIHEFGHFLFARLFKTRVDKFYLFFNPWFSLFKIKKGDTEWGIGWLPLGGYCKIAGMIDESMDKEQLSKPPQPFEFRSKTAGQRLLIISGGVLFNFLLAMLIYAMVLFVWGKDYLPKENALYGAYWGKAAKSIGLQNGDHVVSVDEFPVGTYRDVSKMLILEDPRQMTVRRNNELQTIVIPKDFKQRVLKEGKGAIVIERIPFIIDSVLPGHPAHVSGVRKGDQVVGLNDMPIGFYDEFADTIEAFKNTTIRLALKNESGTREVSIDLGQDAKLGVYNTPPYLQFDMVHETYGFFESIPKGIVLGVTTLQDYVKQLPLIFTKEGANQIGGFGTIGGLFSKVWDWHNFWTMTAFLSVMLAFMNILPIPALDGGYILFIFYEMIFRRKPSEKFLEYAVTTGFILLLTLLVYANGNDLLKFFLK